MAAEPRVRLERDVVVTMRDGARLFADVYLPLAEASQGSRFPTILLRTTYNKSVPEPNIAPQRFVDEGYAVVLQDVRGRYSSDGEFVHGVHEVDDGFDTLEWLAAQPWCDGQIGMTGISYLAAVQCAAALSGSPHLKSIFHVFGPADYYGSCFRMAGNAALSMVPTTYWFAAESKQAQADPVLAASLTEQWRNSEEWLGRLPLKKGLVPLSAEPSTERWLHEMLDHTDYGPWWKQVRLWEPHEYVDEYADIPGLYVGGWYDTYHEEAFYEMLEPVKRGPVHLLMGPWTHLHFHADLVPSEKGLGDVDFGPQAAFAADDFFALQLAWFDQSLKGKEPPTPRPPVRLFVMGGGDGRRTAAGKMNHGGRWRDEDAWPPNDARNTAFYLRDRWGLSPEPPTERTAPARYVFDPADPVPTIGGVQYFLNADWDPFVPYGAWDQRESKGTFACTTNLPLSSRRDVMVFQTPPLEEDVEVTGTPVAHLWVASSAVDTDFTAKLIDVYPPNADYPDGYAMNLCDGVLRMRYRNTYERQELMVPDTIYEIEILLYATSNLFKRGHAIRLDVSSSNFPAFDVNPNNGDEPLASTHRAVIAENAIYRDQEHPSHIRLPIVTRPAS